MQMTKLPGIFVPLFFFSLLADVRADVKLPALFSDNMVLQQGMNAPVWGWADEGEDVTVTFRGKTVTTKAKDGRWMVKLSSQKAGGPDTLVVHGKNRIELKNVLVGEVWVCSGQSNMEWPLSRSFESATDITNSSNTQLRLFLVTKAKAETPRQDVKGQWQESGPKSAGDFSAVAWYFGRELQRTLKVPIGLIGTYWGGSPAEAWMSEAVLRANPDYKRDILDTYFAALRKTQGTTNRPPVWRPAELYNGMIAPLLPYGIKGAIWYQGESNAGRAKQYRTLFPEMISNWRWDWGQGDFPFLAVQLAPFDKSRKRTMETITEKPEDSDWAELREAQLQTTKALPNVGMAVITDVGEKDDIHPKKKQPVGERLAKAALALAYAGKNEYSGPLYKSMEVKGSQALLSFDHAASGLEARGGGLTGFAICGADKQFVWGKAQIQGDRVIVSNPQVSRPVAVRYGWADYPVVNLWNKAGFPASPFRTDDFPMTTK